MDSDSSDDVFEVETILEMHTFDVI